MQFFYTILIIGLCLTSLLLIVFFKAGKKTKKARAAERNLVESCGEESLIRLYDQAESENERDGIVEFVKERLQRQAEGEPEPESLEILPLEEKAPEEKPQEEMPPEAAPVEERRQLAGIMAPEQTLPEQPADTITHIPPLERVDWSAIDRDMQQRREEEARIMAQNQHIQEVFARMKDMEERLLKEQAQLENKSGEK